MEMEINYLQMKRGGVRRERVGGGEERREEREGSGEELEIREGGETRRGENEICTLSQPVMMLERMTDVEVHLQMKGICMEQQHPIRVDEEKMATAINLGHDGQDSSCA